MRENPIYPNLLTKLTKNWGENSFVAEFPFPIVSLPELDAFLASSHRNDRKVGLFKDNVFLTHSRGRNFKNDLLFEGFSDGGTIICNGIHREFHGAGKLVDQITGDLGVAGWMNLYLTPKDRQGFPVHVDDHHVLAIQIRGSKEWTIEGKTRTLNPGSALYIPEGVPHCAQARELSIHASLGMRQHSAKDFLRHLLTGLDTKNQSVPPKKSSAAEKSEFLDSLKELVGQRLAGLSSSDLDEFHLIRANSADRGRLMRSVEVDEIGNETCLGLASGATVSQDEHGLLFQKGAETFLLPSKIEDFGLFKRDTILVSDLPGSISTRKSLARRLLLKGYLSTRDG